MEDTTNVDSVPVKVEVADDHGNHGHEHHDHNEECAHTHENDVAAAHSVEEHQHSKVEAVTEELQQKVEELVAEKGDLEASEELKDIFIPPPLTPKTPPRGSPTGFGRIDSKLKTSPLSSITKTPMSAGSADSREGIVHMELPDNAEIDTSPGTASVKGAASLFQKNISEHRSNQMSLDDMKKRNKELAEKKKRDKEEAEAKAIQDAKDAEERAIREAEEAKERAEREIEEAKERAIREEEEAKERILREKEEVEMRMMNPSPQQPLQGSSPLTEEYSSPQQSPAQGKNLNAELAKAESQVATKSSEAVSAVAPVAEEGESKGILAGCKCIIS